MIRDVPILYDISPPLGQGLAVFPGDTPLTREVVLDLDPMLRATTIRRACRSESGPWIRSSGAAGWCGWK